MSLEQKLALMLVASIALAICWALLKSWTTWK
jgi:hypothetical protein